MAATAAMVGPAPRSAGTLAPAPATLGVGVGVGVACAGVACAGVIARPARLRRAAFSEIDAKRLALTGLP